VIELRVSEAASRAIIEQADYYRQAVGDALALRWETAVDDAAGSLLVLPERGAPCRFQSPRLTGLRWLSIPGFSKHMVFYRYSHDEKILRVVHVIHGARDLEYLLNDGDSE